MNDIIYIFWFRSVAGRRVAIEAGKSPKKQEKGLAPDPNRVDQLIAKKYVYIYIQ